MADLHAKLAVYEGIARFFDSPDLADFVIICGESQWKVHRLALSIHSKVLAKACNSEFLESKQRRLDLSEHDSTQVRALMEYIYKLDYEVPTKLSKGQKLCFHIDMSVLGDKYDIQGLIRLSDTKFKFLIDSQTRKVDLASAASHACELWGATATIRRSLLAKIVQFGLFTYRKENKELEGVMEQYPGFAIEMARAMSNLYNWTRSSSAFLSQFVCSGCDFAFVWDSLRANSEVFIHCPQCKRNCREAKWQKRMLKQPAAGDGKTVTPDPDNTSDDSDAP